MGLWSLLRGFGRRSSPAAGRRKDRASQSADKLVRHCRFEVMEERRMMDADPIKVGVTYIEADSGSDLHGDSFEILFQGGAPNTELTRLVIDGDQGAAGLSVGDMIFDTIKGGLGADEAFNLQVVSSNGIQEVTWELIDGGSKLVFNFKGFHAGEKLVFTVDVDEVQDFDPSQTNQQIINEGIDPIASGVEFQGSKLSADFKAPHYFDTSGTGEFRNIYDPLFAGSALLKSQGNANGLPHDDFEGKRDRSTGVMVNLTQQIKPASIRGRVHLTDREGNCFSEEALNRPLENVKVTLKDEFGNVIGVDFTNANGEYAFENLLPGTYTIIEETPPGLIDGGDHIGTIDGIQVGIKGTNDILTQINLNGGDNGIHYDFCEHEPAQVSGFVYHDLDNDGVRDPNEAPIPGTTVILLDDTGTQIATTTTNGTGFYRFTGLSAGNYTICELQPAGWIDGKDAAGTIAGIVVGSAVNPGDKLIGVNLLWGDSGIEYNFGELKPGSIAGRVWHDPDEDCVYDEGDIPLAGVTIELLDASGNVIRTTTTNDQGQYRFDNLPPGVYAVREQQPAGYRQGGQMVGSHGGDASVTDLLSQLNVNGTNLVNYDFCEILPVSIAGMVWNDPNGNCVYEQGESPIAGVTVQLLDANGNVIATRLTDSEGRYKFDDLKPGTYSVRELQPAGYIDGGDLVGSHGGNNNTNDLLANVSLKSGDQAVNYDFCETPPSKLSGFVFRDGPAIFTTNNQPPANLYQIRDGKLTPDDLRLKGVVLELRHTLTGDLVLGEECLPGTYGPGPVRVTTDANGYYEFNGLPAGNYSIFEVHPEGFFDSIDTEGTTNGLAINVGTFVSPLVIQRFATLGISFKFDAILQVPLAAGQHSQLNNFSEVQTFQIILPPEDPPPEDPPPPGFIPPPPRFIAPPPQIFIPPVTPTLVTGGSSNFTWHLSVIDAGLPRVSKKSTRVNEATFRPALWIEKTEWQADRLSHGLWSLEANGEATQSLFGLPDGTPVVGDWNGDGTSDIGVYLKGEWFLDLNGNGQWDEGDLWAKLGSEADRPVVGDWDGDGKDDIGIFGPEWPGDPRHLEFEPGLPDPENHRQLKPKPKNVPPTPEQATDGERLLRLTSKGQERADLIDHVFQFGGAVDVPLAGDWNGDGIRTVGVYRNGKWHFDMDGDGRWSDGDKIALFGQGGDIPIVGDFDGDGIEEIGIYRAGKWIIDTNGNRQIDAGDREINLGTAADKPVVGDWNGDGIDEPGLYRDGAAGTVVKK